MHLSRPLFALGFVLSAGTVMGCGGAAATPPPPGPAPIVALAPDNVATVARRTITSGPTVSGELTPARESTLRAQVGGSLVSLTVDRGQPVKEGQVIARISSRDLEEAHASAQAALKSSETALTIAKGELQRTEALVKGGALAARDQEQARNAVSMAEAQVAAAKARERSVWQQLDDTTVKAPFAGVVSARPASSGDIVSPGTSLVTIIDPSSMRLEALVPADGVAAVRPGATVTFNVRGIAEPFTGRVDRLNATADPVTRQVAVFVSLPNTGGRLIAGLFAEGRIQTGSREGLVVPLAAVDETGAAPYVTRVRDDKAERVDVTLGAREAGTEQVEITKGLSAGDVILVGSVKSLASGTPVKIAR